MLFNQKGQIEFIIIIGLLAIALVGIFYVFQSGIIETVTTPQDVKEEQNLVKDFVVNIIRDGTVNTLRTLETHGGYLDPNQMSDYVFFAGREAPYWQNCQNVIIPPARENLEREIENHIINSLQGVNEVYGKETEFNLNKLNVEATIHRSKVDVTVNIPTKVRGYLIREPFTATIPTMFGRIIDFAENFANESADTRFWETYTVAGIEMSDLPRFGLLTECGQTIIMDQSQVADRLDGIIRYTLANTELWKKNEIHNTGFMIYGIENVNGKTYPDLDINFRLRDAFSIEVLDPVIISNAEQYLSSSYFPLPSFCVSAYEQKYSVSYSVVISVFDPLLDDYFYFSNFVYLDSMRNGNCDELAALTSSCEETACNAKITVEDSFGSPLDGTIVHLGGCSLNITDSQGVTEGSAPCGLRKLSIHHSQEYEHFTDDITVTSGYERRITLHRKPNITFNFLDGLGCSSSRIENEMVTINFELVDRGNKFIATNNNLDFDLDECIDNRGATSVCNQCDESIIGDSIDMGSCTPCNTARNGCLLDYGLLDSADVNYIPGGEYNVYLTIMNPRMINGASEEHGFVAIPLRTITKTITLPDNNDQINIYIQDSDEIYNRAIEIYEDRKDDQRCHVDCGFGVCCPIPGPNRETEEEAKAAAFTDATRHIQRNWNFGWRVC